jgi:hypothetical protein
VRHVRSTVQRTSVAIPRPHPRSRRMGATPNLGR